MLGDLVLWLVILIFQAVAYQQIQIPYNKTVVVPKNLALFLPIFDSVQGSEPGCLPSVIIKTDETHVTSSPSDVTSSPSRLTLNSPCGGGEGKLLYWTEEELNLVYQSPQIRFTTEQLKSGVKLYTGSNEPTHFIAQLLQSDGSYAIPLDLTLKQLGSFVEIQGDRDSSYNLSVRGYSKLPTSLLRHLGCTFLVGGNSDVSCTFQDVSYSRTKRQTSQSLQFDQNPYEDSYPEDMPSGAPIMMVTASNPEHMAGIVTYSLIRSTFGSSEFEINPTSGTLRLLTSLDFEESTVIYIPVLAQSDTYERAVTQVIIRVEDVNDVAPQFTRDEYLFSVLDSTPIGSRIGEVLALDPDSGLNGQVTYSLEDGGDSASFSVEGQTGSVVVKISLHAKSEYAIVVRVADQGVPALSSNVTVRVYVQNTAIAGHLPPRFTQRLYTTTISELGRKGGQVVRTRASPGSSLQYSIIQGSTPSQNSPTKYDIDPSSGWITRAAALDSDGDTPVYYLLVKVRTTQLPAFTDYALVEVTLDDVNDNVPIFTQSKYIASVLENVAQHTYITSVTALDADAGYNGQITYSIASGDTDSFSVDPSKGHIYTKGALDREKKGVYNFFVLATDQGQYPQYSGTKVQVNVLDVNDCKPVFRSPVMEVYVPENAGRGALVTTLTSIDQDEGQNAAVTYTFLSGDTQEFALDSGTGIVRLDTDLDFETRQEYSIRVQATDGKYFDEAMLVIGVEDVNDHAPVFTQEIFEITISEDIAVGAQLLKLVASDADAGSEQDITYKIEGPQVPFSVDPAVGWVSVSSPLNREDAARYRVQVTATDAGGMSGTTLIEVKIQDVNDNSPVCQPPFVAHLPENSQPGTYVMKVNASDSDAGENAILTFRLVNQLTIFEIDEKTGVVLVISPLDREEVAELELVIQVSDNATNRLSTECPYTVLISDENDNGPIFSQSSYTVVISELTAVNTVVFTLACSDADKGRNGELDFTISSGNEPTTFDIHPRSGELLLIRKLDFNSQSLYELEISVTDRAAPFHTALSTVVLSIDDGNDNAPVFADVPETITISEDTALGVTIAVLIATDVDQEQTLTYHLHDTYQGLFTVENTGSLILTGKLDRETRDEYILNFTVSDSGAPILSTCTSLIILVGDVNDNPPSFALPEFSLSTSPDVEPGTLLLSVTLTDADMPANGPPFTLSITVGNEDGVFAMQDHNLIVAEPTRLSAHSLHMLTLTAADSCSPPLSSTATVTVSVIPANRNPPSAKDIRANLPLFDGEVSTRHVLDITATDPDEGTVLVYELATPSSDFSLLPNGTLECVESPREGSHRLTTIIRDGKHKEIVSVTVQVFSVQSEAAAHPLTVRLDGVTLRNFNEELFVAVLADVFRTRPTGVVLLSVEEKSVSRRRRSVQRMLEAAVIARHAADDSYISLPDMKMMLSREVSLFQDRTGYIVEDMDLDPCLREPCPLSSTCVSVTSYGIVLEQLTPFTSPTCKCQDGFTGGRCDEKIPCYFNPCNSGHCTVKQGVEMCDCGEDWTGSHCDIPIRHCLVGTGPCHNRGTCRDETVGYSCTCQNGYTGKRCELGILPNDLCPETPCSQHSTCTAGSKEVTCTCNEGWAGKYCTYKALDAARCSTNPCQHGGTCSEEGQEMCTCTPGFTGLLCQENVDECRGGPCLHDATCTDGVNGFICTCPVGYSGARCQHASSPCDSSPCRNGGFCYPTSDLHYLCQCPQGYVGSTCETALVAPSYCQPSPCSAHADICSAGLLGYTCTCSPTWRGAHCEISDRSAGGCDLNPCFHGGKCVPQPSSIIPYTCECEPGFGGLNCEEEVDECSRSPCLNGATCTDRTNTYQCVCPPGYSGRDCQISEDPCLSLPCRNGGTCHNVEQSYICQCSASYTGRNCEALLGYCPENHCRNGAQCGLHTDGSIRCTCNEGYHGEYCQFRGRYCAADTCSNGGTCIEGDNGYRCECEEGFGGPECQLTEVAVMEGGHVAVHVTQLKHNDISFKFRTRSSGGLFLYVGRYGGGRDYLILELYNERIRARFSVGADQSVSLKLDKKIADLRWHLLTVKIAGKQISLVLDECNTDLSPSSSSPCFASATAPGAYYSLDTNTPLYLGGADSLYSFLPPNSFQGCFRDVSVDGTLVDMSHPVSANSNLPGCIEHDCTGICTGRSECRSTGGVVSCQCGWGSTGSRCDTSSPAVTLSIETGNSLGVQLLSQKYLSSAAGTMMISLEFRTRIPDCILLHYTSPSLSLLLTLVDGQPAVTLGPDQRLVMWGRRAADGNWHSLVYNRILDTVELELDEMFRAANRSPSPSFTYLGGRGGVVTLAGIQLAERARPGVLPTVALATGSAKSGMIGCARDLRVNNKEVNLISNTLDTELSDSGKGVGCELAPTCVQATCPATHRCQDIWGDYLCACPAGYSGPDCGCPAGYTGQSCQYDIDECSPEPCVHATSCTDRVNDYSCSCKPGYTGKNCQVEIDECATSPCMNGAHCVDLVDGYSCRCPPRYTGSHCEMDTTPCTENPCLHGGSCTDFGSGRFGCACSSGWGGQLCDRPKSCHFDPCVHGACTSRAGEEYVTCECERNWSGATCSRRDCSTCINGDCSATRTCKCWSGYTGAACAEKEAHVRDAQQPVQTWIIILVAVLAVLLVIVVAVIVVCRRRLYAAAGGAPKYNAIPSGGTSGAPQHPYCAPTSPPGYYNGADKLQYNMYPYRQYEAYQPGGLVQMSELSHSTATLDNEIKL